MAELADLWRPTRRNVKGLKDQLAGLEAGTPVAAKFENSRYGLYLVEGEIRVTSTGDLTVAGKFLGSGRAPSSSLLSLSTLDAPPADAAGEPAGAVPPHGSIIRADFENAGHGRFTVTGVAVEAPILGNTAVGAWFLDHELCTNVEILAAAGSDDRFVPPQILTLDDTSETV